MAGHTQRARQAIGAALRLFPAEAQPVRSSLEHSRTLQHHPIMSLHPRLLATSASQLGTEGSLSSASPAAPAAAAAAAANASAAAGEEAAAASVAKPQSFFWRAFKAAFWTGAAVTAGGFAYVTYAYDTNTVKGWVETEREKFNAAHPEIDSVKVAPFTANLARPTLWPALLQNALLDLGEAYVEHRQDAEQRLHEFTSPSSDKLLPDLLPQERHVYTLVLDLDGTLVVSDWRRDRGWRTFKRPGASDFLDRMSQFYEVVVFSDQPAMMVDPIVDRLDPDRRSIRFRLYRDGTLYTNGNYVRDLSKLNRDPKKVLYITANPKSALQNENTITVPKWLPDTEKGATDTSLLDLLPFLEFLARQHPPDTRVVLASYEGQDIPTTFKERAKEYQRHLTERKKTGFFRLR